MFGWHWSTLHVPSSGNFLIFYFALFYSWPWPTWNLPNLPDCEKKSWFCPAAAALPRLLRFSVTRDGSHPRRPRGSKSGWEKGRDESFQVRVKEPLGTDSHQTISKNSSGCRVLIGHKKCFVLLCPIGKQFLLGSFREFVHDGYCLATLAQFVHQACAYKGNFYFLLS